MRHNQATQQLAEFTSLIVLTAQHYVAIMAMIYSAMNKTYA